MQAPKFSRPMMLHRFGGLGSIEEMPIFVPCWIHNLLTSDFGNVMQLDSTNLLTTF